MPSEPSPLEALRAGQRNGEVDPLANFENVLGRANGNANRNTYITLDTEWSIAAAQEQITRLSASPEPPPLFGIPVSLKDCFDLEGFKTSCGSRFYANRNPPASEDSAIAASLKAAGAFLTGKAHLHQLAYGITGQNRDYGDCLQPADATRLTGGSSSGAAASLQEGSAVAAIGTDTGGSVRVPAALCGLSGYRSSLGVADWRGGWHLAPSFDTIGWLFRDLRDAPLLASAIFKLPPVPAGSAPFAIPEKTPGQAGHGAGSAARIGVLDGPLLDLCDPAVKRSFAEWQENLRRAGAELEPFRPEFWSGALDIFAPIQASEAAKLHAGFLDEFGPGIFEPGIEERLRAGGALGEEEVLGLRRRQEAFRAQMAQLFGQFDLLLAPATPVSKLDPAVDQSAVRAHILRFTSPASVCGLPAVVLPSSDCGLQLLAAHNDDRRLLQFAAKLGALI